MKGHYYSSELRANKRADGQHVTVSVAVDQVDDNTKQYTFVQVTGTAIISS